MKRLLTFIQCGLFVSLNLFPQSTDYKINELINAYAENGQFNGTVLVKKGDHTLYSHAFGLANREWNIPNTLDSKFLAGSIGKSITAFMTMILVNDGLIDPEANINVYLPEYSGPGKNQVTIHQLLTHTSGIPDHGAIPGLSKKLVRWTFNTDQYLELIRDLKLKFEPGTSFAYSGIAYNLLAVICERVTGTDFAVLLKKRIFDPLGMSNTKHDKNLDIDFKRADGYEYHLLEGYMNPSFIDMSLIKGSGAVLTTVEDLARFNNECFASQKLLARELYKKIFTPYARDWQFYGYGWWITDRIIGSDTLKLISHGGSTDGYKAYNTRILNDSIDIILLQNNYYRTELGVRFDYAITGEIIDILYGQKYSLPKKSISKELGFIIGQDGIDAALEKYPELKRDKKYYADEIEFDQLGKELVQNYGMKKESLRIYDLAIHEYPNSFLLNYSYGELLADDRNPEALDFYRKCILLYEKNAENKEFVKEYENSLARIKK